MTLMSMMGAFLKAGGIDYMIAQIDSLEHDTIYGRYNSLVKIDDTHYILAYQGDGLNGYIKTFLLT
jgi:hypothetical protein